MSSDQSGIIYCLSKKDAETVADELFAWSGGIIKVSAFKVTAPCCTNDRPGFTMQASPISIRSAFTSDGGRAKSSKTLSQGIGDELTL